MIKAGVMLDLYIYAIYIPKISDIIITPLNMQYKTRRIQLSLIRLHSNVNKVKTPRKNIKQSKLCDTNSIFSQFFDNNQYSLSSLLFLEL